MQNTNKNVMLFLTGASGTGKSTFYDEKIPKRLFYKLISATTRKPRSNDIEGKTYYFRDEKYFEANKFATYLFVNSAIWELGMPKWLYGVTESEILNNLGRNLIYDVIEPKYVRQMIDWFHDKKLDTKYEFKVVWFVPPKNPTDIVQNRANMPNDKAVRDANKCGITELLDAKIWPDYIMRPLEGDYDARFTQYINNMLSCKR